MNLTAFIDQLDRADEVVSGPATSNRVSLGHAPGLKDVEVIREQLLFALDNHDDILIEAHDVLEIDAGVIQVLVAAGRSARMREKRIHLLTESEGPFLEILIGAGLLSAIEADWLISDEGGHANAVVEGISA